MNTILGPSPCKLPKIFDLGVVVDASGSIGEENFKLIRSFLVKLIDQFDIGSSHTRIGFIEYNQSPRYSGFTPKSSVNQKASILTNYVKTLKYLQGQTRTDLAMKLGYIKFFNGFERPYPNVMIVMTDGKTNEGSEPYSAIIPSFQVSEIACFKDNYISLSMCLPIYCT